MKVAVFGSSGFLGRAVVERLHLAGAEVVTVGRRTSPLASYGVDICDVDALANFSAKSDAVVLCSAVLPLPTGGALRQYGDMMNVNAIAVGNVVRWAAARGVRRVVHCSSLSVVARPWPRPVTEESVTRPSGPVTAYAASKLAGELLGAALAEEAGISFVSLRFSALYGKAMPWNGVLSKFIDAALKGERPIVNAGGRSCADFLHVVDAARAVFAATQVHVEGVLNVAAGVESALVDVAGAALRAAGRKSTDFELTNEGVASGALVSVDKALGTIGPFSLISLSSGVEELVEWRREQMGLAAEAKR